jgi:hypothetical protein
MWVSESVDMNCEGHSPTWSSQRLSKGASDSHLVTHVWSWSTTLWKNRLPAHPNLPCQHGKQMNGLLRRTIIIVHALNILSWQMICLIHHGWHCSEDELSKKMSQEYIITLPCCPCHKMKRFRYSQILYRQVVEDRQHFHELGKEHWS